MKGNIRMKKLTSYSMILAVLAGAVEPVLLPQSSRGQTMASVSGLPARPAAALEKLAAPIALYPDPLIAVLLPAAAYPVDIADAARFIAANGNVNNLDSFPWDVNVKAVARFPSVIQKMSSDLNWTVELGQAFARQPAELMNAIQALRNQALAVGALSSTAEQVVNYSKAMVESGDNGEGRYVTNTVVEILPANPEVIYVPEYNPAIIYAPASAYSYRAGAPLLTFGPGYPYGAIPINNRLDWYYGGIYYGPPLTPVWSGGAHGYYPFYPRPPYPRPPWYWNYPHHGNHPSPPGDHPKPPGKPGQPPGKPPGDRPPPSGGKPPPSGPKPPVNTPTPGNKPPPGGKPPSPTRFTDSSGR